MSAQQSSSSDLAWVPAPRDMTPHEIAFITRHVMAEPDAAELLGYFFGEVAS